MADLRSEWRYQPTEGLFPVEHAWEKAIAVRQQLEERQDWRQIQTLPSGSLQAELVRSNAVFSSDVFLHQLPDVGSWKSNEFFCLESLETLFSRVGAGEGCSRKAIYSTETLGHYFFWRQKQPRSKRWWIIPVVPAFGRLRQEDCCNSEAILGYSQFQAILD